MLTARANFLETIKGGSPDRFVKQFEYLELILDPILTGCGGFCDLGQQRTNDWGVTVYWQEGTPGPFPLCEGDDKKIKDITCWRDYVTFPDPHSYPEEAWEETLKLVNAVDRNEKFVSPFFVTGLFEKLHYLMGMEDTMINFYEEPECMHDLINALADWEIECAKEMVNRYHPDALFHHDDWGSQRSTFLAPEMFAEFFLEPYKRIYKFWKDNGVEVIIHHSDSYAATLVPYMIEMGIDVFQGAVSENDIPAIIREYEGKITVQGGLNNGVYDKADWTKEQVDKGVRALIESTGSKYIIPALTMGGPGSVFEGAYEAVDAAVDELSKEYFK